jgi:DNA-binding response OmpR family regulator
MRGQRLAVVHPSGTTSPILARLEHGDADVVGVPAGRAMLGDLVTFSPAAVVVHHEPGSFDPVRVCRDVKLALDVPLVAVSADAAADEALHVALLEAGASDVLAPDASARLLRATLQAALRPVAGDRSGRPARIRVGDVDIDVAGHVVRVDGQVVRCTHLQFRLLVLLASNAGTVVTRPQLRRWLWGEVDGDTPSNRERVIVSALRRVLGSGPRRPRIEVVPRVGYRLVAPGG